MSKERPSRNELMWALRDLSEDKKLLNGKSRHLLLILAISCNDQYECRYGMQSLAEICATSRSEIQRRVENLIKSNYIIKVKQGGIGAKNVNHYRLNIKLIVQNTSFIRWEYRANKLPSMGHLSDPNERNKLPTLGHEAYKAEALPKVAASRALGELKEQREERRKKERKEEEKIEKEWEFMSQEKKHEVIKKRMQPQTIS